jgi:hypothetical protein
MRAVPRVQRKTGGSFDTSEERAGPQDPNPLIEGGFRLSRRESKGDRLDFELRHVEIDLWALP